MAVEIERKFLVHREKLPPLPPGEKFEQGYLSTSPTVRVRLVVGPSGAERAELTIKGKGRRVRDEFEYPIPAADARALLLLCGRSLRKTRHRLGRWELDWFPALDLWLAEIELDAPDEPFERPAWVAEEVTDDSRYANSRLATPAGAG